MRRALLALLAFAALPGCEPDLSISSGGEGPARFEAACALPGLPTAQRQTLIILDQASLARAEDPDAFRERNPSLIPAVVAIADAQSAVASGALAARERVSLYLAPADGGGLRLLFTGCAPALSASELQRLREGSSAVGRVRDDFFASGAADRIEEQAGQYRSQLLGALQRAAAHAPENPPAQAADFAGTTLVRALRATPRLVDPALGLGRVVLIAPRALAAIPRLPDAAVARASGFAAARQLGLNLGLVELHVALAPAADGRDYAQAFFLASGANLVSWSTQGASSLPPPPSVVRAFAGEVQYGDRPYPIELRLNSDPAGLLVNSWLLVRGSRANATPLTGAVACAGERCRVTGDDGGFAQAWSTRPGGEPEFDPDMPFGGLRNVEIVIDGAAGQGRVFDSVVDEIGGRPDIRFTIRRTAG